MQSESVLSAKFRELLPHLDERARRLVLGTEARAMGHGGIETVAKAAGVDRGRVSRGAQEVVVETITATTTRTGLSEHAELDPGAYPTGQTVSDTEMHTLAISPHHWHPEWNYTLHPRTLPPSPPKMSRRPERADPQWAAPAHLLVEVVSAICG